MKEAIASIRGSCFVAGIILALFAGTFGAYDKASYGGNIGYILAAISVILFLVTLILLWKQPVAREDGEIAIEAFFMFNAAAVVVTGMANSSAPPWSPPVWDATIWYGGLLTAGVAVWAFRRKLTVNT